MHQMLRRVLTIIRKMAKNIEARKNSWVWQHTKSANCSTEPIITHILIAKKEIYSKVAKICVESFLHHHPEGRVKLHVDTHTKKKTERVFKSKFFKERIQIVSLRDDSQTWQEQKISLILSMNGTKDVFMDADLRWNSKIDLPKAVTFYVNEFALAEKSPYRQLIYSLRGGKYFNATMRNTSFFTFAGVQISEKAKEDVNQLENEILAILNTEIVGKLDRSSVVRLSEQLALSIASEDWGVNVAALKENDGHKDGAFVESSYFGATGSTF